MAKVQTSLFGRSDIGKDQSFLNNTYNLPLAVHFENIEKLLYNRNRTFDVIKKCAFLPMANERLIDFLSNYSGNLINSKLKVENLQCETHFTELLETQQIGTTEIVQFANKLLTCINNSLQSEIDENFTAKEFKTKYAKRLRSNKMKQEIINSIEEEFVTRPITLKDIKDEPNHLKNKPSSRTMRENDTNIIKLAKFMAENDSIEMKLEKNEKNRKKAMKANDSGKKINRETLNKIKNEFSELLLEPTK